MRLTRRELAEIIKQAAEWDAVGVPVIESLRADQKLLSLLAGVKLKKLAEEESPEAKKHAFNKILTPHI